MLGLVIVSSFIGVTVGAGDTIQGVTPEWKKIVAEFTKKTGQHDVVRWELWQDDS